MADSAYVITILTIFVVVILAMFEAGRSLLGFTFNQIWTLALWLFGILLGAAQVVLLRVWRAHVIVFRNLGFRNMVLPSVARRTTRRD
ncbi:TPA: hypothetical protein ACKPYM_000772 [Stenotrophomonas maltophilia]